MLFSSLSMCIKWEAATFANTVCTITSAIETEDSEADNRIRKKRRKQVESLNQRWDDAEFNCTMYMCDKNLNVTSVKSFHSIRRVCNVYGWVFVSSTSVLLQLFSFAARRFRLINCCRRYIVNYTMPGRKKKTKKTRTNVDGILRGNGKLFFLF